MRPLAIIPARSGSKRLPGKNRMQVGGMSLVRLAIHHAIMSQLFDQRIVVTTDDRLIADRERPADDDKNADPPMYVIERPAELATDAASMMDVVRHAVAMAVEWQMEFDSVVLLQPTSPLRTGDDIRACAAFMDERRADAVVSVVETRDPEVYTVGHAGRLRPIAVHADGRRLLVPNGAVFAIRRDVLDRGLDWWTAPLVYGYEMPLERSVDIDTADDLELARKVWETMRS